MIPKFFKLFTRPYPFEIGTRTKWIFIVLFGAFVFLFLFLYRPFGLDRIETPHDTLVLAGYGLVTILGLAFNIFLLPAVFPAFFCDEKWTVLREVLDILWNIICISLLNTLYSSLVYSGRISLEGFIPFIFYTAAVGIFPISVFTLVYQVFLSRKYKKLAHNTNTHLGKPAHHHGRILLEADHASEQIAFDLDKLYYIKSEGNYVLFFLEHENRLSSSALRLPISRTEQKLTGFPDLIRCHKSYIVNLQKVEHLSGNARGLRLSLSPIPACIPVSRSYIRTVNQSFHTNRPVV